MERKGYSKEEPSEFKLQMETKFYLEDEFDEKGEPLEISPLDFLGKTHFKFRGAIKIDKIYVGSKISLQCKIYDGAIKRVSNERKRLTPFQKVDSHLLSNK